uniref:Uncharacterized protein n=1 Tax=Anopheles minimus TaxID=112268 RepID=A0A182W7U5_9DIPT
LLLATHIAAFQFICFDRSSTECSLTNLYPEREGTFVLQHIPERANALTFSRLIATTVDHTILAQLAPFITYVRVNDSVCVTNVIVPGNTTIGQLFITKTRLSAISFEKNEILYLLSIEKAHLTHIPPTLTNLKNLSCIKINHTPLQQLDVSHFCHLLHLQIVDLNHNQIYFISGQQNTDCGPLLVEIWLTNNRLKKINPNVFVPFSRLESFTLSNNMIQTISGGLKNARISDLLLSHNVLSQLDLCEWTPIPNLTNLYIENNQLTNVPKCLERMSNLQVINLEHNQLQTVSIDVFRELKQLQYIRLSWNPIVWLEIHEHALPPSLRKVDVRYMEGAFLFNHVPEQTDIIDFKNLILAVVDGTIFSNIPPMVSTLSFSGSSAVRVIAVPKNISFTEIIATEPSLVRMRFEKNCTLLRLLVMQSSMATIPPTLVNLPNLTFVKLSSSFIEQINLEQFCNMPKLTSVNFRYNVITTISFRNSSATSRCGSALDKLILGNNKIRVVNMTVFASLRELRIIDFEDNLIEIVEGRFTNTKVASLILSNNNLLAIDLCQWDTMPLINSISFYKNSLQQIPKCLGRLPSLKFINFNQNKLTRITIEAFAMLKELRSLFFTNNAIRTIVTGRRPVPASLQEIFLENNFLILANVSKLFPSTVKIYI